jgi:hypothetical protein
MDAARKAQIIAFLKLVNKTFFKVEEKKEAESKLSEKGKKMLANLQDMASKLDAKYVEAMALMASDMLGEDLLTLVKNSKDAWKFPMFVTVVPTGNANSHDYELNKPVVMSYSGNITNTAPNRGMKRNGSFGNEITLLKTHVRGATEAEIDALEDVQLNALAHLVP